MSKMLLYSAGDETARRKSFHVDLRHRGFGLLSPDSIFPLLQKKQPTKDALKVRYGT